MKKFLLISSAAFFSAAVFAHAPLLDCNSEGEEIHCQGGFSDGSTAFGVDIKVFNYDDEVIFEGRLDEDSQISFDKPDGEFYVQFDGGPGHVIELDYADIEESADTAGQ